MAGSQKGNRGSKNGAAAKASAAKGGAAERRPSDHAREALSEWGQAVRYAGQALRPKAAGRVGHAADALISKLGAPGALASKLGAGSRIVERMRGGGHAGTNGRGTSNDDGSWDHEMPIPIQESMEVAVPVKTAYALCTRFADYPEFIDRVESAEEIDESTVAFEAKVRGVRRRIELEIVDERPNRRIDWEGTGGLEHSGVISFHPLAPSLTHIELTVDLEPQDLVQRLTRAAHLTARAIRADMHRFKAYAELWQEDEEPVDEAEPEDDDELAEDEVEVEDEEESEPVEAG
jgi:uncharacterized membrane protein